MDELLTPDERRTELAKLRSAIAERGIPLASYYERAGVHPTTYTRWLNGKFVPKIENVLSCRAAAKALLDAAPPDADASAPPYPHS